MIYIVLYYEHPGFNSLLLPTVAVDTPFKDGRSSRSRYTGAYTSQSPKLSIFFLTALDSRPRRMTLPTVTNCQLELSLVKGLEPIARTRWLAHLP